MDPPDIYDKIPDHLICPICFEVPKDKVLQCRKGHYMCEECYRQLTNCPQCRLKFDRDGIRNLHIEMMLDKYSWDCPYSSSGCKKKVNRKLNLDHAKTCCFNIQKFGNFVSVCKAIGFQNCSFQMNRGNTMQSILHFKMVHGATVRDSNSLEIEFTDYGNFAGGTKPIILRWGEEGYAFLILVTHKPSSLSWAAFYLPSIVPSRSTMSSEAQTELDLPPFLSSYKVECGMRGHPLRWSTFPVNILSSESSLEQFDWSPLDISEASRLGKESSSPNSLFAEVKVKKVVGGDGGDGVGQDVTGAKNKETLILTQTSMPNISISSTYDNVSDMTTTGTEGAISTTISKVLELSLNTTGKTKSSTNCSCGKVIEHMKCPICLLVPKSKVFQCKNGHHLCEECYPKPMQRGQGKCISCHAPLPLERERIRALVIETMLDELTFQCQFYKYGCNKRMNRKCLHEHVESCYYNFSKFGILQPICEAIGLSKCSFKLNRGNVPEAIRHFEEFHGATVKDTHSLAIQFTDFPHFSGEYNTKPIILNRVEDGYAFLILIRAHAGSLSWSAVYHLRYSKPNYFGGLELSKPSLPYQVECSLRDRYTLTWIASPVDIFTTWVDTAFMNKSNKMVKFPSLRFGSPVKNLLARVKVVKKGESAKKSKSGGDDGTLILTPFSMPNIRSGNGEESITETISGDMTDSERIREEEIDSDESL